MLPLLCVLGSLRVPCLFAMGSIIPVCSTRDEMPFSDQLKDSFTSMSDIFWWLVDWILLIVTIKSSITVLPKLFEYHSSSSSRFHCCVETLVMPLSSVICLVYMHLWSRPCFWFFLRWWWLTIILDLLDPVLVLSFCDLKYSWL